MGATTMEQLERDIALSGLTISAEVEERLDEGVHDFSGYVRWKKHIFYAAACLCIAQFLCLMSVGIYTHAHQNDFTDYDLRQNWIFLIPGPRRIMSYLVNKNNMSAANSIGINYIFSVLSQLIIQSLILLRLIVVRMGLAKYQYFVKFNKASFFLIAMCLLFDIFLIFLPSRYKHIDYGVVNKVPLAAYIEYAKLLPASNALVLTILYILGRI